MSTGAYPASSPVPTGASSRHAGSVLGGLVLGAGTLTIGMVAGIFFDWAITIMPALSEADDRTYVVFMQHTITTMNTSPVFLCTLMGAFVFTGTAAIVQFVRAARASAGWTLAALALYLVAMVITAVVHFPLNDTLESAGDPSTIQDLAGLREDTEGEWVLGHLLRTAAAMVALVCLCRALWLRREGTERH